MPVDVSFAAVDWGTEMFQTLRRELDLESFGINLMVLQPRKRSVIKIVQPIGLGVAAGLLKRAHAH